MFGIPDLYSYVMVVVIVVMLYAAYRMTAGPRQSRRNMSKIMARTDEIAAQAHADAQSIIALLVEIRDRLDRTS